MILQSLRKDFHVFIMAFRRMGVGLGVFYNGVVILFL